MAHFKINIPGNIHADVYKGKVFKKSFSLLHFWRVRKVQNEERTGYIAIVSPGDKNKTEYHLTRSNAGAWMMAGDELSLSKKINGKWCAVQEDCTTLAIKQAIDKFENDKTDRNEGKQ